MTGFGSRGVAAAAAIRAQDEAARA